MVRISPIAAAVDHDSPKYAQALKADGVSSLIFLSGQVSCDAEGNTIHRGDMQAQALTVLTQVKSLIEAGGSTLDKVIKMNVFLTDARHRPIFNEVRDSFFGTRLPPLSVIEVGALMQPEWLIEIDAVAVA